MQLQEPPVDTKINQSEVSCMDLTIALVAYRNEQKTIERIEKDILPALCDQWDVEIICVDNSPEVSENLKKRSIKDTKFRYIWNNEENWRYSKSLNYIVSIAKSEFFVYACTQHGYAIDHTWINDILRPLQDSPKIAMAGSIVTNRCNKMYGPAFSKFPNDMPDKHIQGGVFAGRTDAFLRHPYPADELPHNYSDIYITAELLFNGYDVANVRTIKSLWKEEVPVYERLNYKYIHDDSDRAWVDKLKGNAK